MFCKPPNPIPIFLTLVHPYSNVHTCTCPICIYFENNDLKLDYGTELRPCNRLPGHTLTRVHICLGSYMGNQPRTRDPTEAGSELKQLHNRNNDDNFARQQQPLQVSAEISSGVANSNKDYDSSSMDNHAADDDGSKNLPRELLCTTRSSLVLTAVAFCALQLLTISICVATWLYHRRRHRDADFKIRPTISNTVHCERLY